MLSKTSGGHKSQRLSSEVVTSRSWVLIDSLREHMDTDAIGVTEELAKLSLALQSFWRICTSS